MKTEKYVVSNNQRCESDKYCYELSCENCHAKNFLHIKKGVSVQEVLRDFPKCNHCGCTIANESTWNIPKGL